MASSKIDKECVSFFEIHQDVWIETDTDGQTAQSLYKFVRRGIPKTEMYKYLIPRIANLRVHLLSQSTV